MGLFSSTLMCINTLRGCTWASVDTAWVFFLSVKMLLVMSAMDRPTDHERCPRLFMISKALEDKLTTLRDTLIVRSANICIFLLMSTRIPYLSNKGLVTLDPVASSVWTPAFSPVLLITGTAKPPKKILDETENKMPNLIAAQEP